MEWRHQTWQCPRCRFKLGCCEGEASDCEAAYAIAGGAVGRPSSTQSRVNTSQNASPA
jgi:hypothetical protein